MVSFPIKSRMNSSSHMRIFRIRWITVVGCVCFAFLFLGETFANLIDVPADSIELSHETEESEKEKEKEKETELEEVKALSQIHKLEMFQPVTSLALSSSKRFTPYNIREIETPPPEFKF